MADKFERTYKVDFSFVAGESPSPSKLNAWSRQISNALSLVEKALGDVWDESSPYFDTSDTLSSSVLRNENGVLTPNSDRKLEIANIARLIGPSSALNPIHLTDLDATERQVTIELTTSKVNNLKYPIDSSGAVTFDDDTAGAFITEVDSADLNSDGDYYIDYNFGMIISYRSPASGTSVTYLVDKNPGWHLGDYFGSSYNVIPDQNQSTKCACSGPDGNGLYTITLPILTNSITADDGTAVGILDGDDLGYGAQLRLPLVLQHLVTGDEITGGFLFIRDDTTLELYRDAVYYYENEYSIKVGGVTLDTANGFTVITVGSSITQNIAFIKQKLITMSRGDDERFRLSADKLIDVFGEGPESLELYGPSDASRNPIPQYLHRDGWFSSNDSNNLNDQNGMRGDLVILSKTRTLGRRNNLTDDSYKLIFGSDTTGPWIRYTLDTVLSNRKFLDITGPSSGLLDSGVRVLDNLVVSQGIYSGTTDVLGNHGPLKWYLWEGDITYGVAFGNTSITELIGKTIYSVTGSVYDSISNEWHGGGRGELDLTKQLQPVHENTGVDFLVGFSVGSFWASSTRPTKLIVMYTD